MVMTEKFEMIPQRKIDNSEYLMQGGFRKIQVLDGQGNRVANALDATEAFEAGHGTHAFLYESMDFILEAARQYARLMDGEQFKWRAIYDHSFLSSAVSFFSGSMMTRGEQKALQGQMDLIVRELAERIQAGKSAKLSDVRCLLTISGVSFSLDQLLGMQKIAVLLTDDTLDQLCEKYPDSFVQLGLAHSFAKLLRTGTASPQHRIFGAALCRLTNRNLINTEMFLKEQLEHYPEALKMKKTGYAYTIEFREKTAEMFASLDASSKENMRLDFEQKLNVYIEMLENYKRETKTSVGGDAVRLRRQLEEWMKPVA